MSGRWVWVPDGWRVVPEELTPEMYEAAEATSIRVYTGTITYDVSSVYRATLAAAPEPPSGWFTAEEMKGAYSLCYFSGGYFLTYADSEQWGRTLFTPPPPPPEVKP